jgi:hypothetical protein
MRLQCWIYERSIKKSLQRVPVCLIFACGFLFMAELKLSDEKHGNPEL